MKTTRGGIVTHFRSDYFTNFSNILYINRFSLAYSLVAIEACLLPIIHCRYMNFLYLLFAQFYEKKTELSYIWGHFLYWKLSLVSYFRIYFYRNYWIFKSKVDRQIICEHAPFSIISQLIIYCSPFSVTITTSKMTTTRTDVYERITVYWFDAW